MLALFPSSPLPCKALMSYPALREAVCRALHRSSGGQPAAPSYERALPPPSYLRRALLHPGRKSHHLHQGVLHEHGVAHAAAVYLSVICG